MLVHGPKAPENGVIRFNGVKVPNDNLVGGEGKGLKVALITLNTGRLSIPAACVGSTKMMLEECRRWATERVQWGAPIGKHEAIAHKLADMAATTYGMESMAYLACELSELDGYDIRLEASAAKEWCTTRNWDIIDEAMQIKGGPATRSRPRSVVVASASSVSSVRCATLASTGSSRVRPRSCTCSCA